MTVKPAAGPLTLNEEPLVNATTVPPIIPAMIPENFMRRSVCLRSQKGSHLNRLSENWYFNKFLCHKSFNINT